MAACPTVTLALSLLLLVLTKDCRGDETSSNRPELVKALEGVGVVLGCVGDVTKESLQLHAENTKHLQASLDLQRQNSDSLAAVGRLADELVQIKEQLGQQREDTKHVKEELAALNKVEKLARENENLKLQLATEATKVKYLEKQLMQTTLIGEIQTENEKLLNNTVAKLQRDLKVERAENYQNILKVQDLEHRLLAATTENEQYVMKVQDMDRKLNESLARIKQLEEEQTHLDESGECQEKEAELKCNMAGKHRIRELMHEYNNTKDWNTAKRGLEEVLDKNSTAYQQLKSISHSESLPLYWVGRSGHKDLAELLVCCGRAVNVADSHGRTMLYGAAYSGDVGMARLLLDHGANIEAGYEGGWTPLMNAAGVGQLEFVKLLVSAGANTAATNKQGNTALSWAEKNGRVLVVQYLSQLPH